MNVVIFTHIPTPSPTETILHNQFPPTSISNRSKEEGVTCLQPHLERKQGQQFQIENKNLKGGGGSHPIVCESGQ